MATTITQDELVTAARERFGDDASQWAFVCPNCGDVATVQDFIDAGKPNAAGQECIGRHKGALAGKPTGDSGRSIAERGCDWVAYGLIGGPVEVILANGKCVRSFELAEATS